MTFRSAMEKTFKHYHLQLVFSVKGRLKLIREVHREKIQRYMCGICRELNIKVLEIYCNPDHAHILIDMNPKYALSDFIRILKSSSSKWINENGLAQTRFQWQVGYGAFSYSKSQLPGVIKYIRYQWEHHRMKSFHDDYTDFIDYYFGGEEKS